MKIKYYICNQKNKRDNKTMATKKFRLNNTRLIEGGTGDNPKLMAQALSDGRESLFLEYYLGYTFVESKNGKTYKKASRECERLGLFLWQAPRTPLERQSNKDALDLAKKIRFERGQELLERGRGYRVKKEAVNFLDFFQTYIDRYTKKDIRMVKLAFSRFRDFLSDTPEYNKYIKRIKPEHLNRDMMLAFSEYLQSRSRGEGANSLFARFKKVIKYAVEHDIIAKNPCSGIVIKTDVHQLKKEILSLDEINQLVAFHDERQNPDIRRAFLFCLFTGLRFCDVKDLTFANVDFANRLLRFEQSKTKGHSSSSGVVIPLDQGRLRLIGEPPSPESRGAVIFPLPSYTMCLKSVNRWVKSAGINKHISWHCARHSFAVNVLNNGANIKTVASLLGHSGLQHTQKYTRAIDSLKQEAIESLPAINIE